MAGQTKPKFSQESGIVAKKEEKASLRRMLTLHATEGKYCQLITLTYQPVTFKMHSKYTAEIISDARVNRNYHRMCQTSTLLKRIS